MAGPEPYGTFFQYFATFLGNLLTISYGYMLGITAPRLPIYNSIDTPLSNGPLTREALSWITAMLCFSAIVGTVFFKHLSDCFGRRATLMLIGIIQNLGWFGAIFGYNFTHQSISRCLVGLSAGGTLIVLPIFLIEISIDLNTNIPYIATLLFQALGIMLGSIVGTFVDYTIASLVGLLISVLFSLSFPFVQESPYHYMKKNDIQMLEKSLRYFRAIRDLDQRSDPTYMAEVEKFKQWSKIFKEDSKHFEVEEKLPQSSCRMFQAFLACLIAILTSQLCGIFPIQIYSSFLFEQTGSVFPVAWSTVLLTVAGFVGSLLAIFIASCSWRKSIMCLFSLLIGVLLALLGCFLMWRDSSAFDFKNDWIPFVALSGVLLLANASIHPIAFIMIAELFPSKGANLFRTLYFVLYWTVAVLLIKYHFTIIALIGIHFYFWVLSGACLFQSVTAVLILPRKQSKSVIKNVNNLS